MLQSFTGVDYGMYSREPPMNPHHPQFPHFATQAGRFPNDRSHFPMRHQSSTSMTSASREPGHRYRHQPLTASANPTSHPRRGLKRRPSSRGGGGGGREQSAHAPFRDDGSRVRNTSTHPRNQRSRSSGCARTPAVGYAPYQLTGMMPHQTTGKVAPEHRMKTRKKRDGKSRMDKEIMTGYPVRSFDDRGGNQEFVVPKSSLDNLLGIDSMELYHSVHANPLAPNVHPGASDTATRSRGLGDSMYHSNTRIPPNVDTKAPFQSNLPGERTRFQHNCLRALASMIVCPHTVLPIIIGLFNRGERKDESVYLQTLSDEISILTSTSPYNNDIGGLAGGGAQNRIKFNIGTMLLPPLLAILLGYILGLALGWQLGHAVAVTACLVYLIACCIVFLGVRVWKWPRTIQFAETWSRYMRGCNLLLNILFYQAPRAPSTAQPVKLLPINLNLTTCMSGMDAAALMSEKLWQFTEQKYGKLAVRLQWASETTQMFRKTCCLPVWLWLIVFLLSILSLATLLVIPLPVESQKLSTEPTPSSSTGQPPSLSHSSINTELDGHIHAGTIRNAAIVCAVMSSFSLLALIVAAIPAVGNLIHGRPFQRRRHRYPGTGGSRVGGTVGQPPSVDGCYPVPMHHPFDPTACICPDSLVDDRMAMSHSHWHSDLTSTAQLAAAAASAVVVAATADRLTQDRYQQWYSKRSMRNSKARRHRSLNDVESAVDQTDNHSDDMDDNSDSPFDDGTDEQGHEQDANYKEKDWSNEPILFNSGEFLLHNQNRGKYGRKLRSKSITGRNSVPKDKSSKQANGINAQNLQKWRQVIKKSVLEACKVLSMIDSRLGDRQTRVLVCITGTTSPVSSVGVTLKLATFVRILDRILMQPPSGGTSGDVTLLLDPKPSQEGLKNKQKGHTNSGSSASNIWTPNVTVLLTATVPPNSSHAPGMNKSYSSGSCPRELGKMNDGTHDHSFGHPSAMMQWAYFKIWWSIHHMCHLPIYLEDDPPGSRIVPLESEAHQTSGTNVTNHPSLNLPPNGTLLDLFVGIHQLTDMNARNLRQLITMAAFMGRMLNIDRLCKLHSSHGMVNPAPYPTSSMATLITWLCLVHHWPFHTAWLALFIEQHCQPESTTSTTGLGSETPQWRSPRHRRSLNRTPDNSVAMSNIPTTGSNLAIWNSNLSQLHSRVLKRLASAVEAARRKAMSASMGTVHAEAKYWEQHAGGYPPHVLHTLGICDLARLDRDPRRLAEFLRIPNPGQSVGLAGSDMGRLTAGHITVSQLVNVMKLTPFLNPQISKWIKDIIPSSRSAMSESMTEDKSDGLSATQNNKRIPSCSPSGSKGRGGTVAPSVPHCVGSMTSHGFRVKLKHGFPTKPLSQMTVPDVCQLLRDINDLSINKAINGQGNYYNANKQIEVHSDASESPINDSMPPAPTSLRSTGTKATTSIFSYEDRIKRMNLTGSVLSACALDILEKEIQMSRADWQLFVSVIEHLRLLESGFLSRADGSSVGARLTSQPTTPPMMTSWRRDQSNAVTTVSDTSLALTIKSDPQNGKLSKSSLNKQSRESLSHQHTSMSGESMSKLKPHDKSNQNVRMSSRQRVYSTPRLLTDEAKSLFCEHHRDQVEQMLREGQSISADPSMHPQKRMQMPKHTCQSSYVGKSPPTRSRMMNSNKRAQTLPSSLNGLGTMTQSFHTEYPTHSGGPVHAYCSKHAARGPRQLQSSQRAVKLTTSKNRPAHSGHRNAQESTVGNVGCLKPIGRGKLAQNSDNKNMAATSTMFRDTQMMMGLPVKDSTSTSLAGEMGEEVVDMSPIHGLPEHTMLHELEVDRNLEKLETSDPHSEDHSCDCNYWYSLEARGMVSGASHNGIKPVSGEVLLTPSDSLSSTQSQVDISSGTTSCHTSTEGSLDELERIVEPTRPIH